MKEIARDGTSTCRDIKINETGRNGRLGQKGRLINNEMRKQKGEEKRLRERDNKDSRRDRTCDRSLLRNIFLSNEISAR